MYVPKHFRNEELHDLHALIEQHALAALIINLDGRLEATHVPCVLDRDRGESGTLRFHLARANPSAAALEGGCEALTIFSGPETYISPDWYKAEHLVPTWNFAAVHAYGRPVPLDDSGLRRLLDDLSERNESPLPKRSWTTDKLPGDLYAKMRKAVIAFEMVVTDIQGKWKMNQNRGAGDRAGVVENLTKLGRADQSAVAVLMTDLD